MIELHLVAIVLVAVAAGLSFLVSSSAGMGGSLILVPALALAIGTKEGVAMAALLLAGNNVVKMLAYWKTLPIKAAVLVIVMTVLGAIFGASLLVAAPPQIVAAGVIVSLLSAFFLERKQLQRGKRGGAAVLALFSGATSGFSGTSGPLKGAALRSLDLERTYLVGAAALVSLAGDIAKAAVFTKQELLTRESYLLAAAAVPLMVAGTIAGRRLNRVIGERGYARLFWLVMTGYAVRLLFVI